MNSFVATWTWKGFPHFYIAISITMRDKKIDLGWLD